jgi:hypothetical protein
MDIFIILKKWLLPMSDENVIQVKVRKPVRFRGKGLEVKDLKTNDVTC